MIRAASPIVAALLFAGCAALGAVTPAKRAEAYAADARAHAAACKAYHFDRAVGLVPEVPAMAASCAE